MRQFKNEVFKQVTSLNDITQKGQSPSHCPAEYPHTHTWNEPCIHAYAYEGGYLCGKFHTPCKRCKTCLLFLHFAFVPKIVGQDILYWGMVKRVHVRSELPGMLARTYIVSSRGVIQLGGVHRSCNVVPTKVFLS